MRILWRSVLATKKTSAQKRYEQSEKRRIHNKAIKSRCRTSVKRFLEAIKAKDQAVAEQKLRLLTKEFDSARSKGVLHRNTVSRKKSRMAKLFNVTFAQQAQ